MFLFMPKARSLAYSLAEQSAVSWNNKGSPSLVITAWLAGPNCPLFAQLLRSAGNCRKPLISALNTGDRATGVPVLLELYRQMKSTPAPVDLDALWKELGVSRQSGRTEFDDSAPLASIRQAIMEAD